RREVYHHIDVNFGPDPVGFNREHFEYYKQLTRLRRKHAVLRRGDIEFLQAAGKTLLYRRFDNKKEVFVLFNLEGSTQRFHLPHTGKYRDLLTNAVVGQDIDLVPGQGMVVGKK
ncbi:MAG: DUF3459 domain-containing protein, partial [Saprospiraceae bacterium]